MHPILKRLCYAATTTLQTGSLQKRSPIDVIIPFHHLVSDEPVPYIQSLYAFKNARQFETDLDYLLRNFRVLTLQDVIQQQLEQNLRLQHSHAPQRPQKKGFLVCFDDGLRQVYEVAAPILLRKGVPAALFVNPAFVDNKQIFYSFQKGWLLQQLAGSQGGNSLSRGASLPGGHNRLNAQFLRAASQLFGRPLHTGARLREAIRSVNYLNQHLVTELGALLDLDPETSVRELQPFMTLDQLKELNAKGFAIGAHSIDHPLYSLISPEEQIRQTLGSVHWVTQTFGLPYKAFAFPHVDTGVKHAFFQQLVHPPNPQIDLVLGNSTGMLEKHPRVLHRFIGEDPSIPMEKMVKAVLAYSIIRKQAGRSFVQRGT
jgi:peptidoglycan/xylan/chitin deacetylase (PgdA/CDA1 family)